MFGNLLRRSAQGRPLNFRLGFSLTLLFGLSLVGNGCGLLDVNDPTAADEEEVANAEAADGLRRAALYGFYSPYNVWGRGTSFSALLTDEFFRDESGPSTAIQFALDRRDQPLLDINSNDVSYSLYSSWHSTRIKASYAIEQLRKYGAASVRDAHIGQMFTVRGYTMLALAEHYCAGFPLGELVDGRLVFTAPLVTTNAVLDQALAALDSAVTHTADSARLRHAAKVGRARTLIDLGRFSDAATAVSDVPTDFVWRSELGNGGFLAITSGSQVSVADRKGGNGLDYVSAGDPRVPTDSIGMAFDGVTKLYRTSKYADNAAPFLLASGVEARLIEAEASLNINPSGSEWLTILNTLRTTGNQTGGVYDAGTGGVAGLAPLTDPGGLDARVDLLFRERAFWLFATGHRLGDLRRLIRLYGRDPEGVFPIGSYRLGGSYGTATSMPFDEATEAGQNPAVTGCTEN